MRGMGRGRNPGCKRSRSKAFVLRIQQLTGENPIILGNEKRASGKLGLWTEIVCLMHKIV